MTEHLFTIDNDSYPEATNSQQEQGPWAHIHDKQTQEFKRIRLGQSPQQHKVIYTRQKLCRELNSHNQGHWETMAALSENSAIRDSMNGVLLDMHQILSTVQNIGLQMSSDYQAQSQATNATKKSAIGKSSLFNGKRGHKRRREEAEQQNLDCTLPQQRSMKLARRILFNLDVGVQPMDCTE